MPDLVRRIAVDPVLPTNHNAHDYQPVLDRYVHSKLGNHNENTIQMAAVGLGSVLANIFGYLIIQSMAVGFSIVCTYFEDKKEIGYMYQKTLGINFFLCIIITPILYLSDKILIGLGYNE